MITIAVQPLETTFFIAIRLGTVLLLSPIEAIRLLPIHARLLLVFILSGIMAAHLNLPLHHTDDSIILLSSLSEFANGIILSLSLYAAFAVFQIAGQLIDTHMGLNAAAILNPTDHTHEPFSARLLGMLAVLFFFASNGHLTLLQGLEYSFHIMKPGQWALLNGFTPLMQQCSGMFSLALLLASPVMMSLLIMDICSGILTRNMPQISVYFLSLPLKIGFGLILLGLLMSDVDSFMQKAFQAFFQTFNRVLS